MKTKEHILKNKWISSLLILTCLSLTVLNSQYACCEQDTHAVEIENTTDTPEQEQNTPSVSVSATVNSTFQISLDEGSFAIPVLETESESEAGRTVVDQFIVSQSKSLKILLRRIISTNAP
ncbi:MAG: hypothetical protein JXQ90_20755 [Cyclobacteriaceae bacterium]